MQEQLSLIDGLYEKETDEKNLDKLINKTIGLLDFVVSFKFYLIESDKTPDVEKEDIEIQISNHLDARSYLNFISNNYNSKEFKKIVLLKEDYDSIMYSHKSSRLNLKILLNKIVKNHDLSETCNVAYKKAVELLSL